VQEMRVASVVLTMVLSVAAFPAFAVASVFDDFETGTTANDNLGTRNDDAGDPDDIQFYFDSDGPADMVVTDNTINPDDGNGNRALLVDSDEFDQPIIGVLPQTYTLSSVGDKIRLEVRFRRLGNTNGYGQVFALLNDGGTPMAADDLSTTSDDFGYFMNVGNPGGSSNGSSRLTKVNPAGLGNEVFDDLNALGADFATGFLNSTSQVQQIVVKLTLTAADEVEIDTSFTASNNSTTTTMTRTDSSSPYTSFNQVGFSALGSVASKFNDFHLDDVSVQFTPVPEPSTMALAALGLVGLFVFGRRRLR